MKTPQLRLLPEEHPCRLRHSAWWIEHQALGRLSLGQTLNSTDFITEINLSNTGHFAGPSTSSLGIVGFTPLIEASGAKNPFGTALNFFGGVLFRMSAKASASMSLKYNSPAIAGFTASASVGEDDLWAIALRYAGNSTGSSSPVASDIAQTQMPTVLRRPRLYRVASLA